MRGVPAWAVLAAVGLTAASRAAPRSAPGPEDLAGRLRSLRWRVEQVTVDCGDEPCHEGRWIEVHEASAPGEAPGPRLSLHELAHGLRDSRRIRLAMRLLGEMVHRVEVRRMRGTEWLLEERPRASQGMDGLHTHADLVRMLERLLRPASEPPDAEALDQGLRRLLVSLAGQRPWTEHPALARALRRMAARVGPAGSPEDGTPAARSETEGP